MNTFEKVIFLKSVSLFQYVKDETLLQLAASLEEQRVATGEVIIEKGSLGVEMYMIVFGKVNVCNQSRVLKQLGNFEVFGELTALSPEKRTADVIAAEETLLLKIEYDMLYSLMALEPALSKGIILMLCDKLRSLTQGYNEQKQ